MVQSRTGSGKTAAFGIPFANGIVNAEDKFVQAIILLPTRELALQVAAELARSAPTAASRSSPSTAARRWDGRSSSCARAARSSAARRAACSITCGAERCDLDRVRCAVLDECDEMLSMGFQEDIETILEQTPAERQTLLFSATVPEGIQRLARRFLRNPEYPEAVGRLRQRARDPARLLFDPRHPARDGAAAHPGLRGARSRPSSSATRARRPAASPSSCASKGHDAEAISSDLSQTDRERVLGRMRAGGIKFLVATDVAARGIDIENLSHVFNYTFPEAPEIYIHRTGRTGRAGRKGTAISLIGPTEVGSFYYLKLLYKIKPEERSLPSEAEIRSHREGERVQVLRRALEGDPGSEWRALARRLIERRRRRAAGGGAARAFVRERRGHAGGREATRPRRRRRSRTTSSRASAPRASRAIATAIGTPRPAIAIAALRRSRPGPATRLRRPRDRGSRSASAIASRVAQRRPRRRCQRGPGASAAGRQRGPARRPERRRAVEAAADRVRGRDDRHGRRHERRRRPAAQRSAAGGARVLGGLERGARAGRDAPAGERRPPRRAPTPDAAPFESTSQGLGPRRGDERAASDGARRTDVARLYLNLGRKDGASEKEIRDLLSTHARTIRASWTSTS